MTNEERSGGLFGITVPARVCRTCEYFDRHCGDCLNRLSPRFQTEPEWTCGQWLQDSTALPAAPWNDPAVRWVCEQHPDREFLHDDCPGPGMVEDTPENRAKGYVGKREKRD